MVYYPFVDCFKNNNQLKCLIFKFNQIQVATSKGKRKQSKNKLVQRAKPSFQVGDYCFAKVKGFVEWPGYVVSIENQHAWIRFFNSGQLYVEIWKTSE